jgi:hypothetical protein
MVENWIFEKNLKPFVEIVSRYASYQFDADDWIGISSGIAETDQERDRWFDYDFTAGRPVRLRFARDPGSSVLFIRASCDLETEKKIELLFDILSEYLLSR